MSALLPVPSFEVEGFRAIRHLRLPDLNRVNLFVGKNNAGKTSLLEALRLYMHRDARTLSAVVVDIVGAHVDFRSLGLVFGETEPNSGDLQVAVSSVEALFHGGFDEERPRPIRLASATLAPADLVIRLPWSSDSLGNGDATAKPTLIDPKAAVLHLQSEQLVNDIPLEWFLRRVALRRSDLDLAVVIPASGLDPFDTRVMWDNILVSGVESLAEDALRIIVPDLERIILVGEHRSRSVLCKLKGVTRPIPIVAMGDGTNRVFGLAVALTQARGGALLVDEVENGLHYSVQAEVWEAIFSMATVLDVQVFATTHSWEAVVAFQHAANRSAERGILYRLERGPDGRIYAERYTEEEVAIAAEQQVEVR
jgi:AAA domain, putative AbiEii toxin, Type IV TA system/Protein of unknown function (DUF2813)